MTDLEPTEGESTDLDERDERALSQYLTCIQEAPGLFEVVSESGRSYTVDAREGVCSCPDFTYRDVKCKHQRRVEFATGRRPLPDGVDESDLPRDFGQHVDRTLNSDSSQRAAKNLELSTNQEPDELVADGGEILEEPEIEYTYHVEAPEQGGGRFVRCGSCGAELLVSLGGKGSLIHREGCPAGEGR